MWQTAVTRVPPANTSLPNHLNHLNVIDFFIPFFKRIFLYAFFFAFGNLITAFLLMPVKALDPMVFLVSFFVFFTYSGAILSLHIKSIQV